MRALPGPLLLVFLLVASISRARAGRQVEGGSFGNEEHPRRHHHHRHDVHLAGFFPTSHGHHQSRIGQGVMPAVRLALRDVNRSPHILPNIHLRMHWNNTAVSGKLLHAMVSWFIDYEIGGNWICKRCTALRGMTKMHLWSSLRVAARIVWIVFWIVGSKILQTTSSVLFALDKFMLRFWSIWLQSNNININVGI